MLPGVCARHHHLYYQPYVPMPLTLTLTLNPNPTLAFVAVALHGTTWHYMACTTGLREKVAS